MKVVNTPLEGCLIIEPKVFKDERGYFFESFHAARFAECTGIETAFVQDNQSFSRYGTIRGLHFQEPPYAQAKLVRALEGKILDVVVDLRENSKSFGQSFSIVLSAENFLQLYVPKGMAHGFSVLSPTALVHYKCDTYYHAAAEKGILYKDSFLNIDWQIPENAALVSEKDRCLPTFRQLFNVH